MYQSDSAPWLELYAWETDGSAKTNLVYNTAGISIVVVRDNLANSATLTLAAASGPTDWAAGKFWAMGGNKYRVGIAAASISSFTGQISVEGTYTGGVITGVTREVSAYNPAGNPMASYTQPTGFLAATFPATVSSYAGGAVASVTGAVGSIAGVTFPSNFGAMGINVSGHISRVTLTDTTTTNSDMRGTDSAALAATALSTATWTATIAGRIDVAVSTRLAPLVPGRDIAVAATSGAVELDSAATAALVDLIWDEPLTKATHNVATSSGKRLRQTTAFQQIDSTVIDASATTTTFVTDLTSAVDDFYNDSMLVFTDGALAGQVRAILDYVGATKTIVLEEALTSAPVNGVAFAIVSLHIHPVSQIQSGLATATSIVTLRGADSDTLKTLSDQIDTVSTNVSSIASVSREAF
jgi:hypothetical protein